MVAYESPFSKTADCTVATRLFVDSPDGRLRELRLKSANSGPNIVGSLSCIRLHTTANANATTPNIVDTLLVAQSNSITRVIKWLQKGATQFSVCSGC